MGVVVTLEPEANAKTNDAVEQAETDGDAQEVVDVCHSTELVRIGLYEDVELHPGPGDEQMVVEEWEANDFSRDVNSTIGSASLTMMDISRFISPIDFKKTVHSFATEEESLGSPEDRVLQYSVRKSPEVMATVVVLKEILRQEEVINALRLRFKGLLHAEVLSVSVDSYNEILTSIKSEILRIAGTSSMILQKEDCCTHSQQCECWPIISCVSVRSLFEETEQPPKELTLGEVVQWQQDLMLSGLQHTEECYCGRI